MKLCQLPARQLDRMVISSRISVKYSAIGYMLSELNFRRYL